MNNEQHKPKLNLNQDTQRNKNQIAKKHSKKSETPSSTNTFVVTFKKAVYE